MPFTGRLGTKDSQLGNIVLGIVDSFDLSTIGFRVHVLSSSEVRVKFDRAVSNSALNVSAYILNIIDIDAYLPTVSSVLFYDSDQTSVVLKLSDRLTWTKTYSMQVDGVFDCSGEGITSTASNFIANVQDPPLAVAAYLGRRGTIDLVFDRDVGIYSTSATASIRDELSPPGSGVSMTLLDWTTENIPANTVRFSIPGGTPSADSYAIDYVQGQDIAANYGDGVVSLTLRLRSTLPYDSSLLQQIQFADAFVTDVSIPINVANIRVFFNVPADSSYILNQSNWEVHQYGPHTIPDTVNIITTLDAVSLISEVITLLNDSKTQFNLHTVELPPHLSADPDDVVSTPDAFDYDSSVILYTALADAFWLHFSASGVHIYNDSIWVKPASPTNLSELIITTNTIKSFYNQHIAETRQVSFTSELPTQIGPIVDHASIGNSFDDGGPLRFFADLSVVSNAVAAPFKVLGTIQSEDAGSTTNPLDYTGSIIAREASHEVVERYHQVITDVGVDVFFDRPIDPSEVSVVLPSGRKSQHVFATSITNYGDVSRALNYMIFSYAYHIGPSGATHAQPEVVYVVLPIDYLVSAELADMIIAANLFKAKYNGHVTGVSHTNPDTAVNTPDATDFNSLAALIGDLRSAFLEHNASGHETGPNGVKPQFPGHHIYPGPQVMSANPWTALNVQFQGMFGGGLHTVAGPMVNTDFIGVAYRPSLAAALPIPGLVIREDLSGNVSANLESDSIEIYFSKPMLQSLLQSTNVPITGGSLTVGNLYWKDDRTISVVVTQMENILYSMSAVDLTDKAGNLVY